MGDVIINKVHHLREGAMAEPEAVIDTMDVIDKIFD